MKKITGFFKKVYTQLFQINDSPQRIAVGFGIGVFSGIFPGTGPLAAIFLSWLFRVNKAGALIGSLLTNTWISVFAFLLSIKIGGLIFRLPREKIRIQWSSLIAGFQWRELFEISVLKIIAPVITGYLVIGLCAGCIGYLALRMIFMVKKRAV